MNFFSRPGAAGYTPLPRYDTHPADTDMYELQTHPIISPSPSAPISRKPSLAPTYRTYSPSHLSPQGNPFTSLHLGGIGNIGVSEKGYPYHHLPSDYSAYQYRDADGTHTPYSLASPTESHPHSNPHLASQAQCTCPCPRHGGSAMSMSMGMGMGMGMGKTGWDEAVAPRMMSPRERAVVLTVLLGMVVVFGAFAMLMNAMDPVVEAAS